jgi:hypothetical protein
MFIVQTKAENYATGRAGANAQNTPFLQKLWDLLYGAYRFDGFDICRLLKKKKI